MTDVRQLEELSLVQKNESMLVPKPFGRSQGFHQEEGEQHKAWWLHLRITKIG